MVLFQRKKEDNGTLFEGTTLFSGKPVKQVPLISGRPKRKLRTIVTKPIRFFRKRSTKAAIKKARSFLRGPKKISVEKALALERKQILKGRTGKGRKKLIKEMMGG